MNVLIAGEESQAVCAAFRSQGHDAFSCGVWRATIRHPEWHIQELVLAVIDGNCDFYTLDGKRHVLLREWDLIIAHPPCSYLNINSNRWVIRLPLPVKPERGTPPDVRSVTFEEIAKALAEQWR